MLRTRTIARLTATAVTVGAAIVMTVGPASAEVNDASEGAGLAASCSKTKIYLNDDWGCVISHGDHIRVTDLTWDGNGTRVNWRSSSGRQGKCTDYNGSENGYNDCNYNFPEGTTITYSLQQIDDGEVVDSTGERQAVV